MNRRPRVFEAVRGEIIGDLSPVSPLSPAWRRALVFPLWLVVCVALISGSLRADYSEVSKLFLWGGSAFFWAIAYGFLVACLREAIPGSPISWAYLGSGVVACLVAQVLLAAALHHETPYSSPEEGAWRTIVACSGSISFLGAPLVAAGCILALRGYLVRSAVAGALLGVGAVVAAESVWRLHCPYTSPVHLISAHWTAFLVLVPLGICLLVRFARKRS